MTKRMTIESLLKVFPSNSDKARGADRPPSFIPNFTPRLAEQAKP